MALAALALGARLFDVGEAPPGAWGKLAAVLAIAGLFLLAPAFEFGRSAFLGALALFVAALLAGAAMAVPLASD